MVYFISIACVVYAGILFWFVRGYLRRFYLPVSGDDLAGEPYRLTRVVRIFLSFMHAVALIAVIAWLPFAAILSISQFRQPEWAIDVGVYAGFVVDAGALESVEVAGLRDPVISGKTVLSLETLDPLSWILFAGSNLIAAVIVVFVLLQLRNIFVTLSHGEPFTMQNVLRLKRVGVAVIASYVAMPLLQILGWGAVIETISFNTDGIRLFPAFELNLTGILIGIGVLVLAGVMKEAAEIRDEQRLTV